MNSGIFVCVLGLLICHVTICSGVPQISGNCTLEDLPVGDRTSCMYIDCQRDENGKLYTSIIECGLSGESCGGKKFKIERNYELTHPDCCTKLICL